FQFNFVFTIHTIFYPAVTCRLRFPSSNSYSLPKKEAFGLSRTIILRPIHSQKIRAAFAYLRVGEKLEEDSVFPELLLILIPHENALIFRPQSRSDAFMSPWLKIPICRI
ncbi:hypothetical protein ACTXT7_017404, partial [Hymenolepis weldensis]